MYDLSGGPSVSSTDASSKKAKAAVARQRGGTNVGAVKGGVTTVSSGSNNFSSVSALVEKADDLIDTIKKGFEKEAQAPLPTFASAPAVVTPGQTYTFEQEMALLARRAEILQLERENKRLDLEFFDKQSRGK